MIEVGSQDAFVSAEGARTSSDRPGADEDAAGSAIQCLRFEPPADPREMGRAWREHLAPVFEVGFRPETDLTRPIAMRSYHLGDLIVGDVIAPAHTLERSPEMIRRQGLDHILLQFYRRGESLVETNRSTTRVSEIQCVVFDLAQPVRIVAAAVDATNVVVSRAQLEKLGCRPDALHGRSFDHDDDPFARLVHNFIANVVACGDLLYQREAMSAADAIVRLCATWLCRQTGEGPASNHDLRIRVRRFIEDELGNPSLTPAMIAERWGLSRSTLYRLFVPQGIVAYIQDRRLMNAMRILVRDRAPRPARISQVAYAVGFSDERTFRRAFKRRFGFVPSDAAAGAWAMPRDRESTSVLRNWMESL